MWNRRNSFQFVLQIRNEKFHSRLRFTSLIRKEQSFFFFRSISFYVDHLESFKYHSAGELWSVINLFKCLFIPLYLTNSCSVGEKRYLLKKNVKKIVRYKHPVSPFFGRTVIKENAHKEVIWCIWSFRWMQCLVAFPRVVYDTELC